MKLGAAVVNNEQLNQDQIKVELNKLELKYRLDDLGSKLLQETSEWHIFILKGRLSGNIRVKKLSGSLLRRRMRRMLVKRIVLLLR